MQVVGIVGGIASGKSEVAAQFGQLGATVLDADRLGHQVLLDKDVRQAAVDRWGRGVVRADGELDRTAIAARVFADSASGHADREFWQHVTHPRIREQILARIAEESARNDNTLVVLDAALLLEAGWNHVCQKIVYVDAPRELRLQRAVDRGWTRDDFNRREAAQWNPEEKRKVADFVIDNTGSRRQIYDQVLDVWSVLSGNVGSSPPQVNPPHGLH